MTDQEIPSVLRQQQLVEAISAAVVAVAPAGWTRLVLRAVALGREAHYELIVARADGRSELVDPGVAFHRDVKQLRELMYREGVGTWFTMTLTVDPSGPNDAQFDYDSEPHVGLELVPGAFRKDTERFPRDPEHTPEWLRSKLGA